MRIFVVAIGYQVSVTFYVEGRTHVNQLNEPAFDNILCASISSSSGLSLKNYPVILFQFNMKEIIFENSYAVSTYGGYATVIHL